MQHIDAFCHFFPQGIFKKLSETAGGTVDIGKRIQGVRTIHDLDARFRIMDGFENYSQVLSLGLPPIEGMVGADQAPEFARVANDGLAELCAKYPDRFLWLRRGLPMSVPDEAAKEAERILLKGNANGLQLHTNVNGLCLDEPRFFPIFEIAAKANKPICLHPARTAAFPDFAAEKKSRYEIWTIFGWPYETSATMARLIFSGVMTKLPGLKVMAHHLGAMILRPSICVSKRVGQRLAAALRDEDYSWSCLRASASRCSIVSRIFTAIRRCAVAGSVSSAVSIFMARITCCLLPMRHSERKRAEPISAIVWARSRRSMCPTL